MKRVIIGVLLLSGGAAANPPDLRDPSIWQPTEDKRQDWRDSQPCEVQNGAKCWGLAPGEQSAIAQERERREKNRVYRDVEKHGHLTLSGTESSPR